MEKLKEKLITALINKLKLKFNPKTKRYDSEDTVDLSYCGLTHIPIPFGIINGNFDCSNNKLEDLINLPLEVTNSIDLSNNKIKKIELPKMDNYSVISFSNNLIDDISNLTGTYLQITISNNKLTNIKSNIVCDILECERNQITSLEGMPSVVKLYCDDNLLTSIEGINLSRLTDLTVIDNQITNIKPLKNKKLNLLFIDRNPVTSLKGICDKIGSLSIIDTPLDDLDSTTLDLPNIIDNNLYISSDWKGITLKSEIGKIIYE